MNGRVSVIGAGGHAKVVISTLKAAGYDVVTAFDDDPETWGIEILGVRVAGPLAAIPEGGQDWGVVAIGDNPTRMKIAAQAPLRWMPLIHPEAWVHPSARIGPGTVVLAGAIIQPDSVVGRHAIVNTGATVDHDCSVGDFAHLAPGVHLAGGVRVGEGTMMGIASSAIPGARIGAWSTVGAGGVVVRDLPDGVVAFGIPARPQHRPEASRDWDH